MSLDVERGAVWWVAANAAELVGSLSARVERITVFNGWTIVQCAHPLAAG